MAVIEVNESNFQQEVLKAEGKVLVDFWAAWCGHCRMIAPIVEELEEELTDVKFCKLNVDDAESVALSYKVMSIPTLIVFENGEIIAKSVGVKPKEQIIEMLK